MLDARLKIGATFILALGLGRVAPARGDDDRDLPPPIPQEKFAGYLALVKPYAGEFRWRDEIAWAGTIHEARERAAREDKPILAWQSANSPSLGST
jgi:hypothetical protein